MINHPVLVGYPPPTLCYGGIAKG